MAIPTEAVRIPDSADPQEVLDYAIPFLPVLEEGEAIRVDDVDYPWLLELLPEAVALGYEIIESAPPWPDPEIIPDPDDPSLADTAFGFWGRFDPAYYNNAAFYTGVEVPIEATAWTTSDPPRKRQRTILIQVVQK